MSIYDIEVKTIRGQSHKMETYRGKTLLIVNVASQCGYTPQYAGLQALYAQYQDKGFTVLGFPCDQFGHQEPGEEQEIERFCSSNQVTFPLLRLNVNGATRTRFPTPQSGAEGSARGGTLKWNFTKFLVGPDGAVLKRYGSGDTPESIGSELSPLLK
jgi:glutathione peroxidase